MKYLLLVLVILVAKCGLTAVAIWLFHGQIKRFFEQVGDFLIGIGTLTILTEMEVRDDNQLSGNAMPAWYSRSNPGMLGKSVLPRS